MADASLVNAVPSADDSQEHPVAAPAPAPAADDGKGKAPAANDDEGKSKVQPWEGRPCVVLALRAATAPVEWNPNPRDAARPLHRPPTESGWSPKKSTSRCMRSRRGRCPRLSPRSTCRATFRGGTPGIDIHRGATHAR
ncbi:hypothetical protein ACQJBY_066742 [Aegilops geniculata]